MQCPVCDERMKEFERFGVSIDICPGCKGVWLDRGELDKLIAVSQQGAGVGPRPEAAGGAIGTGFLEQGYSSFGHSRHDHDHDHEHDRDRERYSRGEHDREHGQSRDRRRGSWLGDLFGGDD